MIERRTLIRRMADRNRADVLRGERSIFDGEIIGFVNPDGSGIGNWVGDDPCESGRRINRGEEEWTDLMCVRTLGHSGIHLNDDGYEWEGD